MPIRADNAPMPISIAGETWVPYEFFPHALKSLTRSQVSHRWGHPPKFGPAFPRPRVIGTVQYFRHNALLEFIEESAYPERFSVKAIQEKAKAAGPIIKAKAK